MAYKNTFKGSCHCGNVSFELRTNKDESDFIPRACQCTLCRRHGASWIADPDGKAQVCYANAQDVSAYQFGTRTANFITCKKCGVLTVALCEIDGLTKAVLNIKSMLDHTFPLTPIMTNFDGETVEERLARRKRNWTGEVSVIG